MGRIVVGVDGSAHSRSALRWAVNQAEMTGDRVEAVMAWSPPALAGDWAGPVPLDIPALEEAYHAQLDEIVQDVDASALTAPIARILVCAGASAALLEAAKGADLLVVGSRGHGGFVGLVLGSVSHQVASHAECPVVIVR